MKQQINMDEALLKEWQQHGVDNLVELIREAINLQLHIPKFGNLGTAEGKIEYFNEDMIENIIE